MQVEKIGEELERGTNVRSWTRLGGLFFSRLSNMKSQMALFYEFLYRSTGQRRMIGQTAGRMWCGNGLSGQRGRGKRRKARQILYVSHDLLFNCFACDNDEPIADLRFAFSTYVANSVIISVPWRKSQISLLPMSADDPTFADPNVARAMGFSSRV